MTVTEYLEFRFDLGMNSKYDRAILEELLNHKEKYPLLTNYISDIPDMLEDNDYELFGCVCDDPDFEMTTAQGQQLLCAAIAAFINENKDSKLTLTSVNAGTLLAPGPYLSYISDFNYVNQLLGKDIYSYYNHMIRRTTTSLDHNVHHMHQIVDVYVASNPNFLDEIKEKILNICGDLTSLPFSNDDLNRNKIVLENGTEVYPINYYSFTFRGNKNEINELTFYTSRKENDSFKFVFESLKDIFDNQNVQM